MSKPSLLDRLAQPRSLAAIFAAIMTFIAITAIPAEARRHGHRHHARHNFHHHFAHSRMPGASHHGGDEIIGEHRGFAAIVVDGNSGRTIYARNEHELRHPASVTKVMTLYLLFEQLEKGRLRLDTPLMISSHAAAQAPSKLGLQPGETISVENAIKAVVTKSANDIACAIAENIGGDERSFAQMMTRKAHALGMRNTHYANASGLPDPTQITTAYDLAVLGRAIQDRFPRYYRYFSTHSFAYNGALHANHNHLLGRVEGMDGIKTGYTRASGFNLLTSVRRGSHHIVAVVMGGATAAGRDHIMANLIEEHIAGGSTTRTAAAITEDSSVADEEAPAIQRVSERRVAIAEPAPSPSSKSRRWRASRSASPLTPNPRSIARKSASLRPVRRATPPPSPPLSFRPPLFRGANGTPPSGFAPLSSPASRSASSKKRPSRKGAARTPRKRNLPPSSTAPPPAARQGPRHHARDDNALGHPRLDECRQVGVKGGARAADEAGLDDPDRRGRGPRQGQCAAVARQEPVAGLSALSPRLHREGSEGE